MEEVEVGDGSSAPRGDCTSMFIKPMAHANKSEYTRRERTGGFDYDHMDVVGVDKRWP